VADKPPSKPSESVENFLKAVYTLQKGTERVSTNALANALNILPPSVTDMARRMAESNLVDYRKYYGIRLTDEGEATALKVIRRHRLIELYLVQELGYDLPSVHEDAERLEHVVSDRFVDAIDAKLSYPTIDPHGDPIPSADGIIAKRDLIALVHLKEGVPGRVRRLVSDDNTMLEHILERGFQLDAIVEVKASDPFDGPITVLVDGEERVIGCSVAASILVDVID
jgi:DtxR family Mn-dependent transcriptional regulator